MSFRFEFDWIFVTVFVQYLFDSQDPPEGRMGLAFTHRLAVDLQRQAWFPASHDLFGTLVTRLSGAQSCSSIESCRRHGCYCRRSKCYERRLNGCINNHAMGTSCVRGLAAAKGQTALRQIVRGNRLEFTCCVPWSSHFIDNVLFDRRHEDPCLFLDI